MSVHPHRRGDGRIAIIVAEGDIGSPPQAWGRHVAQLRVIEERRFTPTGVGTARVDGVEV